MDVEIRKVVLKILEANRALTKAIEELRELINQSILRGNK